MPGRSRWAEGRGDAAKGFGAGLAGQHWLVRSREGGSIPEQVASEEQPSADVTDVASDNEDVGVGGAGEPGSLGGGDRRHPDLADEGLWRPAPPSRIEDYAIIADLQTAGLVSRDGSIDWLCLPRFDSSASFAALLGGAKAGRWRIAPISGGTCTRRSYREDTLILESVWETDSGVVSVTDFMPRRQTEPDVVRFVQGKAGRVRMGVELVVRFDYGRVVPWVRHQGGRWVAVAGPDALWLDTPVPLQPGSPPTRTSLRATT